MHVPAGSVHPGVWYVVALHRVAGAFEFVCRQINRRFAFRWQNQSSPSCRPFRRREKIRRCAAWQPDQEVIT